MFLEFYNCVFIYFLLDFRNNFVKIFIHVTLEIGLAVLKYC